MLRLVSVFLRKVQSHKDSKQTLSLFEQWKKEIDALAPAKEKNKKILIIRLDDIGDYLLFRNSLSVYKQCPRWKDYEITLLGSSLWRELYDFADSVTTDNQIWINKKDYFDNDQYRIALWKRLRNEGFEVVICPSRVRPLLLDDMCLLACAAPLNIGSNNGFYEADWNHISDRLCQELFTQDKLSHEFFFNNDFASWCCGEKYAITRPHFPANDLSISAGSPFIICFIGASTKSRRWPAERWIALIQLLQKENKFRVILAGGKSDAENAEKIRRETDVESITGKVSLVEMAGWAAKAALIISNNTMAAHLAVSLNKRVVIVASGDNFSEFCAYKEAGISGVATIYPEVFMHLWKKRHFKLFRHYIAVTNDIATITARTVFKAYSQLLKENTEQ